MGFFAAGEWLKGAAVGHTNPWRRVLRITIDQRDLLTGR